MFSVLGYLLTLCKGDGFRGFGKGFFSVPLFLFCFVFLGPRYDAKKKFEHTLLKFLFGSAKLVIWLMRKNKARGAACFDPILVITGLLKDSLGVEYDFYKMTDNVMIFSRMWSVLRVE